MTMTNSNSRLIDVSTGCGLLGMTTAALRARIRRRQIPIVRIGGRIYLDPDAIERWIKDNSEPAIAASRSAA